MPTNISLPSLSVIDVNVPEVSELVCEFKYNYYTVDERTTVFDKKLPAEKVPRYVFVKWQPARLSGNDAVAGSGVVNTPGAIQRNVDKIISETEYANPDYLSHTFSDISAIEQASADMESYSRITNSAAESVSAMGQEQVAELVSAADVDDLPFVERMPSFQKTFSKLSNLPKSSLGLQIISPEKKATDDAEFLKSVIDSTSLNVKINKKVTIDIFRNSIVAEKNANLQSLKQVYADAKKFVKNRNKTLIDPVSIRKDAYTNADRSSFKIVGYIVQRYEITPGGLEKESTFYVDGGAQCTLFDQTVLYGKTYFYSIKTVLSLKILAYAYDEETPVLAELYIASRPVTSAVECFEYVPPPEPEFMSFIFDYTKRNMLMLWEAPTNSQQDIKQYQVFRRKSIKEPFELIAQYCFDKSDPGPGGQRYTTGEVVDGNSTTVPPEYAYLLHYSDVPVLVHRDEDFVVDEEFHESSEYIYAVCSVDAHGMVSNYSTQYHVTFDPFKNRVVSRVISDPGAPKPYPNMKLRLDAFKDALRISGEGTRRLSLSFSPEYFKLSGKYDEVFDVVETKRPTRPDEPYYLLQMINVDNQKYATVKIVVDDPEELTK